MILTGKAKEDFFNWLDNQGVNGIDISNWEFEKFHSLSNVSKNSLIIEWFDSVKLFIEISFFNDDYWTYNVYTDHVILEKEQANICQNREDAIKQAIVKANNIYNEKYSISQ